MTSQKTVYWEFLSGIQKQEKIIIDKEHTEDNGLVQVSDKELHIHIKKNKKMKKWLITYAKIFEKFLNLN